MGDFSFRSLLRWAFKEETQPQKLGNLFPSLTTEAWNCDIHSYHYINIHITFAVVCGTLRKYAVIVSYFYAFYIYVRTVQYGSLPPYYLNPTLNILGHLVKNYNVLCRYKKCIYISFFCSIHFGSCVVRFEDDLDMDSRLSHQISS